MQTEKCPACGERSIRPWSRWLSSAEGISCRMCHAPLRLVDAHPEMRTRTRGNVYLFLWFPLLVLSLCIAPAVVGVVFGRYRQIAYWVVFAGIAVAVVGSDLRTRHGKAWMVRDQSEIAGVGLLALVRSRDGRYLVAKVMLVLVEVFVLLWLAAPVAFRFIAQHR